MSGSDTDATNRDGACGAGCDTAETTTNAASSTATGYDSDATTCSDVCLDVDMGKQKQKAQTLKLQQEIAEVRMQLKQQERNTKAAQQHAQEEAYARAKERNEHAKVESSKLGKSAKSEMVSLSVAVTLAVLFCY